MFAADQAGRPQQKWPRRIIDGATAAVRSLLEDVDLVELLGEQVVHGGP